MCSSMDPVQVVSMVRPPQPGIEGTSDAVLQAFLAEKDEASSWAGLQRVIMKDPKEGVTTLNGKHVIWVCNNCAAPAQRQGGNPAP